MAALAAGMLSAAPAAAMIYDESVHGDLSPSQLAPTDVSTVAGSTVEKVIGTLVSNDGIDVFFFSEMPVGVQNFAYHFVGLGFGSNLELFFRQNFQTVTFSSSIDVATNPSGVYQTGAGFNGTLAVYITHEGTTADSYTIELVQEQVSAPSGMAVAAVGLAALGAAGSRRKARRR